MKDIRILMLSIIIAYGLQTFKGFKDLNVLEKFSFDVDQLLVYKDYKRLISSGFLHADWTHFKYNMITLYLFRQSLEAFIGITAFLALCFVSLMGGDLLALYIHRNTLISIK